MTTQTVGTVGIMFQPVGTTRDAHRDFPFPTLAELDRDAAWSRATYDAADLLDRFGSWFVVAYDPRGLMYADDGSEAMDATNWAAIIDAVEGWIRGDIPVCIYRYGLRGAPNVWGVEDDELDDADAAGTAIVRGTIGTPVLIVRGPNDADGADDDAVDTRDLLDELARMQQALSDYPLLDEDAYSDLEHNAWMEYAPIAFVDELRDLLRGTHDDVDAIRAHILNVWRDAPERRGMDADDAVEAWADAVESAADEILPIAASYLDYYGGFTGEYHPNFLRVVIDLLNVPTDVNGENQTTRDAARLRGVLDAGDTGDAN